MIIYHEGGRYDVGGIELILSPKEQIAVSRGKRITSWGEDGFKVTIRKQTKRDTESVE